MITRTTLLGMLCLGSLAAVGCAAKDPEGPTCSTATVAPMSSDLDSRAYIVSRDSPEVRVLNLQTLEVSGTFEDCGGRGSHMAELNAEHSKLYVAKGPETVVFDARTGRIIQRIALKDSGHLSLSRDGLMAVTDEGSGSVAFVDTRTDTVVKILSGFIVPHNIRFAPDGKYAYVANIGGNHITRVALSTLEIDGEIVLDGIASRTVEDEGGFADAQIDRDGILYAAHAKSGRVIVYDTQAQKKLREIEVGRKPWIVFADHPFAAVDARVVPNLGEGSVSVLRALDSTAKTIAGGDSESFGVNYSSLVPDLAFVMNRFRREIAVVNTKSGERVSSIDVGGTTETAATTPDGRFIVATVSSANRVVVIDARTQSIVKTLDGMGSYPWSVTIPKGQNYCH